MTSVRARSSLLPRRRSGRVRRLVAQRPRMVAAALVGVAAAGVPSPVIASAGGGRRITDAEHTRTVYLVVGALVLLAIALAVFTWWFWRATRREHEALAPLEVMSDRKFVAYDTLTRQVLLDGNRPVGAAPLAPGAPEPLILPADAEPAVATDDAPATTPIAGVETGGPADTPIVNEPAADDSDATTAAGLEPAGSNGPALIDPGERAGAGAVAAPLASAGEADVTTAIAVSEIETPVAASSPTIGSTPLPIDPGLPLPLAEGPPARPLSLAELVALEAHAPLGFDDDELASTPSTGIPVIESAEAWVERQLVGANGEAVFGPGDLSHDMAAAEGDDPDEPTPAAVRGAE